MSIFIASLTLFAAAQNDKTQANAYDDAWETGWVTHCRNVYSAGTGKTTGFVLQVGDSITHSNPYSQWPRYGAGQTTEDQAILTYVMSSSWNTGSNNDTTNKNGWYLAAADTSGNRGMTASSGLSSGEFTSGNGNGGTAMPADSTQSSAAAKVADGTTYTANLHMTTVAAAFGDARFAVLMLGTNDANGAIAVGTFTSNLTSIVDTFEANNIVVVVSTVPPSTMFDVTPYNSAIRTFAQTRGLPLIDYYAEILARQPVNWSTTLISGDGIHPTGAASSADPYTPGGNPATHQTGSNAATDGYLLRSWLTVQKLKEVKSYVVDGVNPPSGGGGGGGAGGAGGGTGGVGATPAASGGGSSSHKCGCNTVGGPLSPSILLGALAILAWAGIRRR